ncbi:MAG TPA: CHRD domain-containing protein [Candidatus Limnocylindrales bacterium]|nr:CHRD domain-containing protein [Candidatus Limnocylindrales bacterium]
MRKARVAMIVAALALMAVPATASAVDPTQPAYGGPLTGAQENPAVATTATGQGTAVISADGSTITYIVSYSGLSGTVNAAHIHTGAAGSNGGVILPLTVGPSPMTGTLTAANFTASGSVTTFAEAVAAIKAGTTYFNLHTTANPGGEIRGQITAAGDAYFADLNGAQENPAVGTTATGKGLAVISADASTITYLVTYSGLSGTANAAHIHTGAVGSNGGVILPLTVGPSPMVGTLTATNFAASGPVANFADAIGAIRAGTTYFNIHTSAHPGGEIRGQIGVTVAAPAGPAVMGKVIGSHGTLMVAASNGMTLYTFTKDVAGSGKSNCTGGCLTAWPALTVPAGTTPTGDATVTGQLGTIVRADNGQTQVTYNGLPLYFFQNDKAPGDTNGIYTNWEAVVLVAPAATPAPTVAPPAPTLPPTSVETPILPAGDGGAIGLVLLIGFLAMLGMGIRLERRRPSAQR